MDFIFFVTLIAVAVWAAWVVRRTRAEFVQGLNPIPLLCFLVVVTGAVFGREFFAIEAGPIPVTLDRILLLITGSLFVGLFFIGKEQLHPIRLVDIVVFAWILLLLFSTLSHDWSTRENLPASRLLFFNLLPAIVYFLCRYSRLGHRDMNWISIGLLAFGVYLALTAVAEWRGWQWAVFPRYISDASQAEFLGRGRGPFRNPVSNGIFLVVAFGVLVTHWPRIKLNRWKFVGIGIAFVLALGIYATLTRSVWLAMILSFAIAGWFVVSQQKKAVLLMAGAAVAMVALFGGSESLMEFKRDKHVSSYEMRQSARLRPLFAIMAMRMFEDRPVFGHGFGQYADAKMPYLQDPTSSEPLWLTKPYMQHNVLLSYITETGLLGLSLLVGMLFLTTRSALLLLKRDDRPAWQRRQGVLFIVLVSSYLVNGMFHDVSIAPLVNMLLMFMAGLTVNMAVGAVPSEESIVQPANHQRCQVLVATT